MRSAGQRGLIALTIAGLVLLGAAPVGRLARGLSLVNRAASLQVAEGPAVGPHAISESVHERPTTVVIANGSLHARVYSPRGRSTQTVLLVAGLHPAGIDDPRFVALARELASSRITVVTPDISELPRFEITPALTDRIEQAAVWLAGESDVAPTGRIGMMGISFSGGLSVVAAGRPALRDRVAYVFSCGGHDDLPRVLRYFCTGTENGAASAAAARFASIAPFPAPHDYGLALILLNVADHVVPPGQVDPLRHGVRRFLHASYLDRWDKASAEREFALLRALARDLPLPAGKLLEYLNDRDSGRLGLLLLPHIESHAGAGALSPAREGRHRHPCR